MSIAALTLSGFFELCLYLGFAIMLLCLFPAILLSKIRRNRRRKNRLNCRLCAYRFVRRDGDEQAICPHCQAKNR